MKNTVKNIVLASIFSLGVSVSAIAKDVTNLGKDIALKDKTKISDVMKSPENFVGKNILVEGKVVDVCTMRGCWMKVSSDKKRESMTVKVKDGEMVFPVSARGKNVLVEGELFKVVVDQKEQEEMKKDGHDGHDHKNGETHDHPEIMPKKAVKTIYMFKPKGVKFSE